MLLCWTSPLSSPAHFFSSRLCLPPCCSFLLGWEEVTGLFLCPWGAQRWKSPSCNPFFSRSQTAICLATKTSLVTPAHKLRPSDHSEMHFSQRAAADVFSRYIKPSTICNVCALNRLNHRSRYSCVCWSVGVFRPQTVLTCWGICVFSCVVWEAMGVWLGSSVSLSICLAQVCGIRANAWFIKWIICKNLLVLVLSIVGEQLVFFFYICMWFIGFCSVWDAATMSFLQHLSKTEPQITRFDSSGAPVHSDNGSSSARFSSTFFLRVHKSTSLNVCLFWGGLLRRALIHFVLFSVSLSPRCPSLLSIRTSCGVGARMNGSLSNVFFSHCPPPPSTLSGTGWQHCETMDWTTAGPVMILCKGHTWLRTLQTEKCRPGFYASSRVWAATARVWELADAVTQLIQQLMEGMH